MKINFEQLSLRKQILYLVLVCSLITMIVAGGITLYGMFKVRSNALQIGTAIGESAAEKSSQTLKKVSLENLQTLVQERAKLIYYTFVNDMFWDVTVMSNEMNKILRNPQEYLPRSVSEASRENSGELVPQLQYKEGVNRSALAYEIGLTANLQDFQIELFTDNATLASNYVASLNGFNITVDINSELRVDENNIPRSNDYSSRPWYRNAMREGKITLTDIFNDARGRGLAIACSAPYFDSNGEIAGVVGEGRFLNDIVKIVSESKMGETGFAFVINEKSQVIFSPKPEGSLAIDYNANSVDEPGLIENESKSLAYTASRMIKGETGIEFVIIDGKNYYLAYAPIEQTTWSYGMVLEEDEVTVTADSNKKVIEDSTVAFIDDMDSSIRFIIIVMALTFMAALFFAPFIGKRIADAMTKQLNILADGVREIASGNLDKRIEVSAENEVKHLATCFNAMTDELKNYMANLEKETAERERISTELNVATNIQLSALPHDFDFGRKDFEIYATMHAAKEVGGDFYDFYLVDEKHLVVTMADVSGKGVPAALFMMKGKTILKNLTMMMNTPDDLASVMGLANQQLCQGNDEMMFITIFHAMLDLETGRLIYVNGGHNPPVLYHDGKFEYMSVEQNCVVGIMDDMDFEQQEIQLAPGDILYMYTDGVTEAMDEENNQYGEDRLLTCLNSTDARELPELLEHVKKDLGEHVGKAPQSDDITMLALKWRGTL